MSDVFAEATVRISPTLTGFVKDLETQLAERMKKVKAPVIRVKPGLTLDFVGDLRKQVNDAITRAQSGIKPIRVKALIEPVGVASTRAGIVPGSRGGGGGGSGTATKVQTSANQALARSLELVATAQLNLNRAFDETIPLEEQVAAVTKVTTSLEDAQAAAERELAKASVAKDAARKRAAQKQLADIADFQKAVQPRAAAVQAQVASTQATKAEPGVKAAIASSRRISDQLKTLVSDVHKSDEAFTKLGTSTKDLAAHQDLLNQRTKTLTAVTKLEGKAQAVDNAVIGQGIPILKARATAAVEASNQQVAAIDKVAKADAANAAQAEKIARQRLASQQRAARAAASAAANERRRSEQLSRGGQASILSLAGIRGATLAASRSFLVGAAAITVFARAVKQFADLERNLDVFRATTAATAEQMKAVREEATKLGADLTLPSVAAGDAAGAMVELAKAGLSVEDAISAARGVLELATAAAIDTADAVRLTANVLNAFNLAGRDAIKVADTLANAANLAQGSIADIGTAFQQAASAGHQVGLSFQDTATFLTILAKNGLRGSDAGTSLRTALIRLVNPSKEAAEQFKKLGIVLRDAEGHIRPDVFLQIADATRRLGPAQRDATIALIGGQDAFRAVTILGRQSVSSFLRMRAALREEGTAAELARARTEGLHGAMDGLQSVLETVGTNIAAHVDPAFATFVRTVSGGITTFSENAQVAGVLTQTLQAMTTQWHILGQAIADTLKVAIPLGKVFAQLATGIGVQNILAGVIAFKAINAAMDGAIVRMRILRPLFGSIAAARFGTAIAQSFAQVRAAEAAAEPAIAGFGRLSQVQRQLALNTAAAAPRMATVDVILKSFGPTLRAAATSGTALTVAVAATAAAFIFLATRETNLEGATRRLREETDRLAKSFDRVKAAGRGLEGAERAALQAQTGVQQAQLNLRAAQEAAGASNAAQGSRERQQLILSVKVATQDLAFANQDLTQSLQDLAEAQGEQRSAEAAQSKERGKSAKDLRTLIVREHEHARSLAEIEQTAAGQNFDRRKADLRTEVLERQNLIQTLREQANIEALSTEGSDRQIALRKRLIASIVELSKIDVSKLAPDLSKILVTGNLTNALRQVARLFGLSGKAAVDAFVRAVETGLASGKSVAGAIRDALAGGAATAGPSAEAAGVAHALAYEHGFGHELATTGPQTLGNAMSDALSGASKLALAEATGASLQAQLTIALNTQRIAASVLTRAQRAFDAAAPGTPEKAKRKATLERAITAKNEADADVERITGEITSASKDAAQKAKDAQEKIDQAAQAQIDAITQGRKGSLLQRRITSAGLTAWLGDDLKSNEAWLKFLQAQKERILKLLKATGASKKVIQDFRRTIGGLIFDVSNEIKRINKDIADNAKERQKAVFDTAIQKADLRIRIAEARDDTLAELKARRAKLALITAELVRVRRQVGKNTVAWLELKAEQAEEIAAIKDLEKQQKQKQNASQALMFSFLQTLQGFTFNLLGNLIPGFASTGLVGPTPGGAPGGFPSVTNTTSVPDAIAASRARTAFEHGRGRGNVATQAAIATGAAQAQGATAGQSNTQIHWLKMIFHELHKLNAGHDHPEAHHQRKHGAAAMDYSSAGAGASALAL